MHTGTDCTLRRAVAICVRGSVSAALVAKVFDEAMRAIARIHPNIDPQRIRNRFVVMNAVFKGASIDNWHELMDAIVLPDANDRHVLAAAIIGGADAIVTENISDFPIGYVKSFGIEVVRLDDFLLGLKDMDPVLTMHLITERAASLDRPPMTALGLLERIALGGAPRFAEIDSQNYRRNDSNRPSH